MAFDNRKYVIIPTSHINQINFSQVMETSEETCRYSMDHTLTFVKYEGVMPTSVQQIMDKSAEYTHDEIMQILHTEEWTCEHVLSE